MHPAYSVIFFTVSSGAGYGLLAWLTLTRQFGLVSLESRPAAAVAVSALVLVTAGLLSSTFHLGHPERAWRAISQWRTSWLSREGLLAIITYFPAMALLALWWFSAAGVLVDVVALTTALLSVATVFSTAMIYTALTTIPRWANSWVPATYLLLAAASGGLLLLAALALVGEDAGALNWPVLAALVLAWLGKLAYWRHIDGLPATSHSGTATGLSGADNVRSLEWPHTSANFVQREMGYQIARKHAAGLRRLALWLGLAAPGVCLLILGLSRGRFQAALVLLALLAGVIGILIERWLFFAEAEHVVTLYYGALRV